jgi:hypothetical protein
LVVLDGPKCHAIHFNLGHFSIFHRSFMQTAQPLFSAAAATLPQIFRLTRARLA